MSLYFISDLHLDIKRPASTQQFVNFAGRLNSAEALYILGDFVEYWLGDDDDAHQLDFALEAIAKLSASGAEIYFMHGNRDFLIGSQFLRRYGAELLPDPTTVDLYGQKALLTHGDLLCTDDLDYQNFRSTVRNPDWQTQFLAKTLDERRAIVMGLRETSRQAMQEKADEIMDVNQHTVEQYMKKYGVKRLIHGHTHRPGIHNFHINNEKHERIVLGDWYQGTSILKYSKSGYRLLTLDQLQNQPSD